MNPDHKNHIKFLMIDGLWYKVLRLNSKRVAILGGPWARGERMSA